MKEHVLGSLRMTVVMTALLGFAYPAVVWGVGQVAFREKADGGFLRKDEGGRPGRIVGTVLFGQSFHSKKLFFSRPSAAGDSGYDATASGGTNLGPTSNKLADSIRERVAVLRAENLGAAPLLSVPADAVTSSASGLDPHISPAYATLQIPRVSRETRIPVAELEALIADRTESRFLGLWGEPRVNVLLLNLEIARRTPSP